MSEYVIGVLGCVRVCYISLIHYLCNINKVSVGVVGCVFECMSECIL